MKKLVFVLVAACGPHVTGYQIVQTTGSLVPNGAPGDAVRLGVSQNMSDGSATLVAADRIAWSGAPLLTAQGATARDVSPFPVAGDTPTAVFIANPERSDRPNDLNGVLFILDPGKTKNGSIPIVASLSEGITVRGSVTVVLEPLGDADRGAVLYGPTGANCGRCHGATGHGSPANADGTTYTFDYATYDFPAPGLNAEDTHLASDSGWNAGLLALASRSDMDNGGVALRAPMLDYLSSASDERPEPLTARDFADLYAFLQTQTH